MGAGLRQSLDGKLPSASTWLSGDLIPQAAAARSRGRRTTRSNQHPTRATLAGTLLRPDWRPDGGHSHLAADRPGLLRDLRQGPSDRALGILVARRSRNEPLWANLSERIRSVVRKTPLELPVPQGASGRCRGREVLCPARTPSLEHRRGLRISYPTRTDSRRAEALGQYSADDIAAQRETHCLSRTRSIAPSRSTIEARSSDFRALTASGRLRSANDSIA
jgi:hypothetical protein